MSDKTGIEKFLTASDDLFGRAADFMNETDFANKESLGTLKEVCDIVRITAVSMKTLKEGKTGEPESPTAKLKRKANGNQIAA